MFYATDFKLEGGADTIAIGEHLGEEPRSLPVHFYNSAVWKHFQTKH